MKLVIALGNADLRYANTRHNVGFWCLDAYADARGVTWKQSDKFRAHIAEVTIDGERALLAKPTTFYNLVGESGRAIAEFYKITPADILIIHDDFALPLGTIRTRAGGSAAGNNGIKSINQHLGDGTLRLRVGTYADHRDVMDDVDFVLSHFSRQEQAVLDRLLPMIHEVIDQFVTGTFESTTHSIQTVVG